jgi:lipopolysaccharide heptosyltransferase I
MNLLIVRLGALGDIVHAIPAAAALRRAFPAARIDWLVDAKHRTIVDLVTAIDRVIVLERASPRGWTRAVRELRTTRYDAAIDLQGLMKSAVLARASGAARVVGFSIWHLREKTARPFYSAAHDAEAPHIITKNLQLLETVGVHDTMIAFPIADVPSAALDELRAAIGAGTRFALINPGAAWPNKRWPSIRFGEIAAFIRDVCGLTPVVLWGPGEEDLARSVVEFSGGRAVLAPRTSIADILAFARAAALVVSGDTGPLHLATAVGTPTVSLFGPTDPVRNGPFAVEDVSVSRYDACECHYDRTCHAGTWCLDGIQSAIQRRLAAGSAHG